MELLIILIATLLSVFSTAVMGYITMATPIGPWIEPTLVLLATIIFRAFVSFLDPKKMTSALALTTFCASIGGILATGFGFSFPTLYFLDPNLFNSWLSRPLFFCSILSLVAFAAGSFAFLVSALFQDNLLNQERMSFPVGQMVSKMITAQNQFKKSIELTIGIVTTFFYLVLQKIYKLIPQTFCLIAKKTFYRLNFPSIFLRLDQVPMLIAIGFITGHVIAKPLAVGLFSKIFLINPMHQFFFKSLSNEDFMMAFASGLVLYGAVMGFINLPKTIKKSLQKVKNKNVEFFQFKLTNGFIFLSLLICALCVSVFTYFKFSILSQIYLLILSFVCTYQLMTIAGEMGIAPVGRFATYVMVPGMLIFGFNFVQITIVALFIEVSGGVASDLMFGRKMAQISNIDQKKMIAYQWLGLLVSSLCIGIIFYFLINYFGLGSYQLFAQKAQSRALLINFTSFNIYALALGIIFSIILTFIKVNPVLLLGGLLMPIDYSLMLILGGMLTYFVTDKENYYPFWSGVFAANSIWMFLRTLL